MRTYPRNSPQAAGRIVALALLADGHLSKAELDVLERLDLHEQIGLDRAQWHDVLHTFCEDLLTAMHLCWGDTCRIDPALMKSLMAEVDDPDLRAKVMHLAATVVEADEHVSEGESIVLLAILEHWHMGGEHWGLRGELAQTRAE